jgi:diguanylate cyclase (GGDEF)-like protein
METNWSADARLPGVQDLHVNLKKAISDGIFESLLLFDLDDFRRINQHHGRRVGDEILSTVFDSIASSGREGFRIGGDQFALIVKVTESPLDAEAFLSGAGEAIRGRTGVAVTFSGGGLRNPGEGLFYDPKTGEIVFSAASQLQAEAKREGRNRILWLPQEPVDSLELMKISARFYLELARVNASFARAMERESRIDFLTGVYNRKGFESHFRRLTVASKRDETPVALLYLDSDSLKTINDTGGHDAGDRFIIDMAQVLNEVVRGSDFISRWAGDEFAVVLNDTTIQRATALANRIRRAIEARTQGTVSIGIFCGIPQSTEDAVGRADRALYRAKQNGKNRVEVAE